MVLGVMQGNKETKKAKEWDKGLNFSQAKKEILKDLSTEKMKDGYLRSLGKENKRSQRIAYDAILLIQLLNGARIGEAVSGAYGYINDGYREQAVRVEKRKNKEILRSIIIPSEISRKDLENIKDRDPEKVKQSVKTYAMRHFGFNTHSFRYAFITYMATERKQPVNVIARITEHTDVNMLTHYIEKRKATEILRDVAK